eukprot:TRINITY_DN31190_c0_g1_i1.p1 TRINITY_DN31190_c0_g1~~TRINITY_DN31190_c0_g1_i1.p1  ORF type:complete len:558 (-),score=-11.91 TRINITY_DN31190_c0_g1_i1:119-1792(-)
MRRQQGSWYRVNSLDSNEALPSEPHEFPTLSIALCENPMMTLGEALDFALDRLEAEDQALGTQTSYDRMHVAQYYTEAQRRATAYSTAHPKSRLNNDELAAISLYTTDLRNISMERVILAHDINKRLQDRDRIEIRPFAPYVRILLLGLAKMPTANNTALVFRGVDLDLHERFAKRDRPFTWQPFTSTTTEFDVLRRYYIKRGSGTVFQIVEPTRGIPIHELSEFPEEAELLMAPLSTFVVLGQPAEIAPGLWLITLKETPLREDILTRLAPEVQAAAKEQGRNLRIADLHLGGPSTSAKTAQNPLVPNGIPIAVVHPHPSPFCVPYSGTPFTFTCKPLLELIPELAWQFLILMLLAVFISQEIAFIRILSSNTPTLVYGSLVVWIGIALFHGAVICNACLRPGNLKNLNYKPFCIQMKPTIVRLFVCAACGHALLTALGIACLNLRSNSHTLCDDWVTAVGRYQEMACALQGRYECSGWSHSCAHSVGQCPLNCAHNGYNIVCQDLKLCDQLPSRAKSLQTWGGIWIASWLIFIVVFFVRLLPTMKRLRCSCNLDG